MEIETCGGLVINMPEAFADPAFKTWFWSGPPRLSWARDGRFNEWSDIVVLVDPGLSGEGSDDDMPDPYWSKIMDACHAHFGARPAPCRHHHMVRLTNLSP